ncbi:YqcC family protein [Pseudomonas sp. RIT-PI-S]|uniref:YqcC family protein n=1 Tax=Pseudomonas sp. RIT-PI-S TaxID=3035295 RepID=UPI0021DA525F|nr:YqcC family protein [Pseudomonas sp. RIT-PI-S]
MDSRLPAIADQLLLIEQALRQAGWWADSPPSVEALASPEPFCIDTLQFEEWLQWIFLPRMKLIVENGLALPDASGILAMAEMIYVNRPGEAIALMASLRRFDLLISGETQA